MPNQAEIAFRIVVEQPPPGVAWAMQIGKTDLLPPTSVRDTDLIFDFHLRLKRGPTGQVVLVGAAAQGTPEDRFVYVNSGTLAGQADSPWTRRAKIKLAGIAAHWVEQASAHPDARLEARMAGTDSDGGPACATVPVLDGGWRLVW